MNYKVRISPTIGIIIILSLVGSLMIYYSTYWGPWAYSDSAGYIVSARNLLRGNGLGYFGPSGDFMPLSIHPPFYSLVLSVMGLLGIDLIIASRWLNIVLFGATILLSGIFTYSVFGSAWFSLSLCVVLLTMPAFVDVSSGAMSELLFLFTATLGICLLILHLDRRKSYLLILASVLIGLSFLSRINGIALVGAGAIGLLFAGRISWKQRLRDLAVFCFVSVAPIAIWLLWIYSQSRSFAARNIHLTLNVWSATTEFRSDLMSVFWSWLPFQQLLPPYSYRLARNLFIFIFIFLFLLVGLIVLKRLINHRAPAPPPQEFTFAFLWILFVVGNILLLVASFAFLDLVPNKDTRTFFYIEFGLVFAFLALISSVIKVYRLPSSVGWILAGVVFVLNISNVQTSWQIIDRLHNIGEGYTSQAWHMSTTLKAVRNIPSNIPLISNQSAALLLLLDRPAYDLCNFPCEQSDEIRYGDNPLDPVQQIFREDNAALVFFHPGCGVKEMPWYSDIMAQLKSLTRNLTQYFNSCDGEIYFYPTNSP